MQRWVYIFFGRSDASPNPPTAYRPTWGLRISCSGSMVELFAELHFLGALFILPLSMTKSGCSSVAMPSHGLKRIILMWWKVDGGSVEAAVGGSDGGGRKGGREDIGRARAHSIAI